MEQLTVGRKKAKPDEAGRRPVALIVRGMPEWGAWVARLAEHCRSTVSDMVDDSLVAHAKKQGFTEKPPRR